MNGGGRNRMAAGISLGVGFGLVIGLLFGIASDSLAFGIAIGIAIGAGLGTAFRVAFENRNDSDDEGGFRTMNLSYRIRAITDAFSVKRMSGRSSVETIHRVVSRRGRRIQGYSITEETLHRNVSTMDGVDRGARRMPVPSTGFRIVRAAPPMVVRT